MSLSSPDRASLASAHIFSSVSRALLKNNTIVFSSRNLSQVIRSVFICFPHSVASLPLSKLPQVDWSTAGSTAGMVPEAPAHSRRNAWVASACSSRALSVTSTSSWASNSFHRLIRSCSMRSAACARSAACCLSSCSCWAEIFDFSSQVCFMNRSISAIWVAYLVSSSAFSASDMPPSPPLEVWEASCLRSAAISASSRLIVLASSFFEALTLIALARLAYRTVDIVSSKLLRAGDSVANMVHKLFPPRDSCNTRVSLELR
mmetsp:Transcript_52185/g.138222  ORF Transcript_52185/g.138222 Transcript_52185/m.138222 type:complete len:261 (+) Transcript_52185:2306-3088(+)